jgi:hypothetical protein
MLDPQDRVVLMEALSPPEGFALDEGIATTYSLDLITLLSAPLAFTLFEWEDDQGQPTSNPVLLLEALRRHIGRLTIFCQAGRISVPPRPNPLFGYLEDCVVEVKAAREHGVFHPKVWVLRFVNPESGAVFYRLLCLSRNLTDDRSWDLSLVLEGPLVDRRKAFARNHPLGDFVAALPDLAMRSVSDPVRQRANRIAEELRRVDFAANLPDDFEDVAFHPLGIEGHRAWPLPEMWDRGLIVSPFVDDETAEWLARDTTGSVLVSRAEELDRLERDSLKEYERVFVLTPNVEGELEPGDTPVELDPDRPQGLHAKFFLCEIGRTCHLFVGSANATTAAFERNVEFLVELVGKRTRLGVDQFLYSGEGQASLQSLLVPYEPPATPVDDSAQRALEDLLDGVRTAMALAGWELHAEPGSAGRWHLRVARPSGSPVAIPDGVKVRVWPVTLEESEARPVQPDTFAVRFAESGVGSLTSFLACEVSAVHQGRSASIRFVLNLPLVGAPSGRREAILRIVLDDPQKVLRFLQFLLHQEDPDPAMDMGDGSTVSGAGSHASEEGFVLLESLLRALAHEPRRLDEVASLLKDLGDDEDGRARIPAGLLNVWPAIWAAREALRK